MKTEVDELEVGEQCLETDEWRYWWIVRELVEMVVLLLRDVEVVQMQRRYRELKDRWAVYHPRPIYAIRILIG